MPFSRRQRKQMRNLPVCAQDFVRLNGEHFDPGMTQSEAIDTLGFSPDSCRICFYRTTNGIYWLSMRHASPERFERFLEHCGHRLDPQRREQADLALSILLLKASDV